MYVIAATLAQTSPTSRALFGLQSACRIRYQPTRCRPCGLCAPRSVRGRGWGWGGRVRVALGRPDALPELTPPAVGGAAAQMPGPHLVRVTSDQSRCGLSRSPTSSPLASQASCPRRCRLSGTPHSLPPTHTPHGMSKSVAYVRQSGAWKADSDPAFKSTCTVARGTLRSRLHSLSVKLVPGNQSPWPFTPSPPVLDFLWPSEPDVAWLWPLLLQALPSAGPTQSKESPVWWTGSSMPHWKSPSMLEVQQIPVSPGELPEATPETLWALCPLCDVRPCATAHGHHLDTWTLASWERDCVVLWALSPSTALGSTTC